MKYLVDLDNVNLELAIQSLNSEIERDDWWGDVQRHNTIWLRDRLVELQAYRAKDKA